MSLKGFTLVELLGVVVLIALLTIIAFPKITDLVSTLDQKSLTLENEFIYNALKLYMEDNKESFTGIDGNKYYVTIKELVDKGYLNSNISVYNDISNMDSKCMQINYNNGYTYELRDVSSCQFVDLTPVLHNKMVPVKYNGTNWVVANISNDGWFNYENREWANAVILRSGISKSIGQVVSVTGTTPDIIGMFVWIPRFEYKITGQYGKDGISATSPGEIEINFISKSKSTPTTGYNIAKAFTFGTELLSGIWVGKFETTGTSTNPTILPNKTSLNNQAIGAQFTSSQLFNNYFIGNLEADSHLMRNSEWAAISYLSQSIYGKYGNNLYTGVNKEIYQNKSTITGNSNGTPSSSTTNTQCSYNDLTINSNGSGYCGCGASTTGNITGIYDMSGGLSEYVMAFPIISIYGEYGNSFTSYLGFSSNPDSKYYDYYTINEGTSGWYDDTSYITYMGIPWFVRGGVYTDGATAGIFTRNYNYMSPGTPSTTSSFRVVLK